MNKKENNLKIIFLGGVGEIGKNMTLFEYQNDIIVVDAGMSFPNDQMPGIDYVIPEYNYLIQNKEKIKGIVITHGHEDHIGALPFVLKDIDAPVYASKFSIALINHKLKEAKVKDRSLITVQNRETISLGSFRVEFVRVSHSIAGAFGLFITSPKGKIFLSGDFKIDYTPIDNKPIDLARISEIGNLGINLLMMDSTNVERKGYSMSEKSVYQNIDSIFGENINKRIIVATFASNIHRVQQIINCALKYNRKIAFSGRSMVKISEIARDIGELNFPRDNVIDISKIDKIPYDRLCIISTGTQGEPMSALSRMSQNDFKKVIINENDAVLLSSSPIPGNEKSIYNVINNLYKKGAEVYYQSLEEIHVSGHACQEELKLMFQLLKPKNFIPIHGEYRHLKQHTILAKNMGINEANIIIPEIGFVVNLNKNGIKRSDSISTGSILLDGSVVTEESDILLRDRRHLAADGFVVVIVTINEPDLNPPIIISRGLNINDDFSEELKESICNNLILDKPEEDDFQEFKQIIRKIIGKAIVKKMKKKPMIMPIIIDN